MKRMYFIAIIFGIVTLVFSGCSIKETTQNDATIYVSVRHSVDNGNKHILSWHVENRSPENISQTFENGDIVNYEIIEHRAGKKHTGNPISDTVILHSGDSFQWNKELIDFRPGKYEAHFWALSKDNKRYSMILHFEIE